MRGSLGKTCSSSFAAAAGFPLRVSNAASIQTPTARSSAGATSIAARYIPSAASTRPLASRNCPSSSRSGQVGGTTDDHWPSASPARSKRSTRSGSSFGSRTTVSRDSARAMARSVAGRMAANAASEWWRKGFSGAIAIARFRCATADATCTDAFEGSAVESSSYAHPSCSWTNGSDGTAARAERRSAMADCTTASLPSRTLSCFWNSISTTSRPESIPYFPALSSLGGRLKRLGWSPVLHEGGAGESPRGRWTRSALRRRSAQ